jgi:uncharacterized protein (DUF433 family)
MTIVPINYIEVTPSVCGGKPRIAGRRITVQNVVVLYRIHGWSVEQITEELELTPSEIHAALSYYHDHQEEIDQSIRDADALAKAVGKPVERLRQKRK